MYLSEWQSKMVINVLDGRKLGVICDLELDVRSGRISGFMVATQAKWWQRWVSTGDELWVSWPQLVKVGDDVILVKIDPQNAVPLADTMRYD